MRPNLQSAAVVTVGLAVAMSVALATGAGATDVGLLIVLPLAGSVGAALVGFALLRGLRHRSLRSQVLVIAFVATIATVVGVFVAALAMFISPHDVGVLAVVLVVSTAISATVAMRLGSGFERSAAEVTDLARHLDQPGTTRADGRALVTGELQRLASELASVSAQLDASRRREHALDAARRELVSWVSHDLRSPIGSIRAMAEALVDGVVDDRAGVDAYHLAIRQESERLGALADDLFELSRITSGATNPDQPFVPLGELVAGIVDGIGLAAAARGVHVVNLLDETAPGLVPASDLRRVLHNLLDNAIRHTPDGGSVVLDGEVAGPVVAVSVADECGGIPESELPRVFDVAFRGDASRSRDTGGGGLGLAIARGLLEVHDGTLQVVNRPRGCRFTLRLPTLTA